MLVFATAIAGVVVPATMPLFVDITEVIINRYNIIDRLRASQLADGYVSPTVLLSAIFQLEHGHVSFASAL